MRIAVVGSGIAGLTCAHLLGPDHEVVLYEARDRLGGHANTIEVDDPELGRIGVDTGFIVYNDRNYPNFVRLLEELGVAVTESEMSFAVADRLTGFHYRATSPSTLFADRRRLIDPAMWRMLFDIGRFYRQGRRILAAVDGGNQQPLSMTIGDLLQQGRFGEAFIDNHLLPMGAAVWSTSVNRFTDFPAVSLLRFLDNHGLLSVGDRPQWRTIVGGSRAYVAAIERRFDGRIRLETPVRAVRRSDRVVTVIDRAGSDEYDHIILACHSDQILDILSDASEREKTNLGAVPFRSNEVTVHTDTSVLPPHPRAWAAWTYEVIDGAEGPTVTYDLTRLMRLATGVRYLVSLNDQNRIDPRKVICRLEYSHPVFDHDAIEAQHELKRSNGSNRTSFCGAWMGYGFHEDGMAAAVDVCRALGSRW